VESIRRYPQNRGRRLLLRLEALQNAAKHAAASRASIRLTLSDGEFRSEVADDGPDSTLSGPNTQSSR
jgi:signal transduction histidine kinase